MEEHCTDMDVYGISAEIFKYTNGHPYLVSRICQLIDSNSLHGKWVIDDVQVAVKIIATEKSIFDNYVMKDVADQSSDNGNKVSAYNSDINIDWVNYMIMAAQHSKGSAAHWFRYLRKDIDKYGALFTKKEIDALFDNENLTLFQRVSLRTAFEEGSPTRQHIIGLNNPAKTNMLSTIKEKLKAAKV